jgi:tripartite-type tricarboxylate transporter receptor subunit TctC
MVTSQHAIVSGMYESLKYDLVKDFSPISLLGTTPFILVVNPSLQVNSIKELVTLAKSRPGVLQYGSPGSGMAGHLSAEIFKFMTGTDILHVPYKGASQAVTGTLAGEVNMTFQAIPAVVPMINSGKLRALGVTSAKRTPMVPDVPAISESVPGYEYSGWYSLVAPTKTPPGIISKLHAEVVKALNASAMRERMTALGVDTIGSSPEEFATYLRVQLEKMKEAVKVSGARPEN